MSCMRAWSVYNGSTSEQWRTSSTMSRTPLTLLWPWFFTAHVYLGCNFGISVTLHRNKKRLLGSCSGKYLRYRRKETYNKFIFLLPYNIFVYYINSWSRSKHLGMQIHDRRRIFLYSIQIRHPCLA